MALAAEGPSLKVDALSYLRQARQALINILPPNHALRGRVQSDGYGELLAEQPPGRLRISRKVLPVWNRGRGSCDPTMILARHMLKTMWNEKYHLKEWDRARKKMSEHRKRLGMRERPCEEGDGGVISRRTRSSKLYSKECGRAAGQAIMKRRRSIRDSSAPGVRRFTDKPPIYAMCQPDSAKEKRQKAPNPVASRRDRKVSHRSSQAMERSGGSKKALVRKIRQGCVQPCTPTDRKLSPSPPTMSNGVVDDSQWSRVGDDLLPNPSFPTATDVSEALQSSEMCVKSITKEFSERFSDRFSYNVDNFDVPMDYSGSVGKDNPPIRRREANDEKRDRKSTCG